MTDNEQPIDPKVAEECAAIAEAGEREAAERLRCPGLDLAMVRAMLWPHAALPPMPIEGQDVAAGEEEDDAPPDAPPVPVVLFLDPEDAAAVRVAAALSVSTGAPVLFPADRPIASAALIVALDAEDTDGEHDDAIQQAANEGNAGALIVVSGGGSTVYGYHPRSLGSDHWPEGMIWLLTGDTSATRSAAAVFQGEA